MHKFGPKHINSQGVHFLWFKWFNLKDYCLIWECGGPVWWIPKIIKGKSTRQFGWLIFAVGYGWQPVNEVQAG